MIDAAFHVYDGAGTDHDGDTRGAVEVKGPDTRIADATLVSAAAK
jgi:hypothetical protein